MHPKLKAFVPLAKVLVCLAAFLIIAIGVACAYLSPRRAAARKKYPVGTAMQDAIRTLQQPYYIYTNNAFVAAESYVINAASDGLVLEFDRDQKLTRVELLILAK